jgi:hypothetical protein
MSNQAPIPATKRDVEDAIKDLKLYILERELKALRWFLVIGISYFSITLASVWFMIAQLNSQLLARINELIAHLPK